MTNEITPMLLTFNEAPNIRRTLEKLAWAKQILIVDSFSTDETLEIIASFPQAQVVQRKFDSFAMQCNFGLKQISTEWVLSLDADYVLSDDLIDEIGALAPPPSVAGYSARFQFCVCGRPLRASLYPPRSVLYRRALARYHDEGHGHRVRVKGEVSQLKGVIYHDDRKPLDRWIEGQRNYAQVEASFLEATPVDELGAPDRLRRLIVPSPFLAFLYILFGKGLILDGWPGWFYACQRAFVELLISLHLLESRLGLPKPAVVTRTETENSRLQGSLHEK